MGADIHLWGICLDQDERRYERIPNQRLQQNWQSWHAELGKSVPTVAARRPWLRLPLHAREDRFNDGHQGLAS